MPLADAWKRLLVGRKLKSGQLHETLLGKKLALPVFATDALSSVGYATQEIMLVLALAGVLFYKWTWVAGGGVILVMLTVVASYRQNVHAYPSGGGDYENVTTNLGALPGLTTAAALMVDYVMTVAVSISSGVDTFLSTSAFSRFRPDKTEIVLVFIGLMMLINLRGVRESGKALAVPVYAFMVGIFGTAIYAVLRVFVAGDTLRAASSTATIVPEPGHVGLSMLALVFLVMRAFASGCTALTGIEAISNGVPAFRKPKSKNAASTLLALGLLAIGMFGSVTVLALYTRIHITDPSTGARLIENGQVVTQQGTVIAQLADTVFSNFTPGVYYVTTATLIILVLAANTAFNGFPVLGSILARDGYLPRQLHTRGDRLAFSNGIVLLGAAAAALVAGFHADVSKLIQLYIVGVFVSFTLSQLGMIRHWNRILRGDPGMAVRQHRHILRSRAINAFGFVLTGLVLVVVVVTKFTHGAYIAMLAMAGLVLLMRAIRGHYRRVSRETEVDWSSDPALPARVHAIVLVSKVHKPMMRALSYARATRPNVLEAVTVDVEPEETARLVAEWEDRRIPVPLKVLASPYREITKPIVDYVTQSRRASPRDLVNVYIPEYVVGHWWSQVLHNQSALRLKGRLLFTPGVLVTSVPFQLSSSAAAASREPSLGVRRPDPSLRPSGLPPVSSSRPPPVPPGPPRGGPT